MRWPAIELLNVEFDDERRAYFATVRCADGSTYGPAAVWDLKRRINWELRTLLEARVHEHQCHMASRLSEDERTGVDGSAARTSADSAAVLEARRPSKGEGPSRCTTKAIDQLLHKAAELRAVCADDPICTPLASAIEGLETMNVPSGGGGPVSARSQLAQLTQQAERMTRLVHPTQQPSVAAQQPRRQTQQQPSVPTAHGAMRIARARHPFTAQCDGELSCCAGDALTVLDELSPEGWLAVRRLAGGERGLVPAAYLETCAPATHSRLTHGCAHRHGARAAKRTSPQKVGQR